MGLNMTQMFVRPSLPIAIPMNVLDRAYVVPETDDERGSHFPMSLVIGLSLPQPLSSDQVLAALQMVNDRFPQFRLGYRLDAHHDRWLRVPGDQLARHLADMVRDGSHSPLPNRPGDTLDALISAAPPENITPFTLPIQVTLTG